MKTDVVYTIGGACDVPDYWELRMSLRSLSFFRDLGNVFIVGKKPNWCVNVHHIHATDPYTHNKDANLINKLILACMHPNLSNNFLWFSDDQYVLRDCNLEDVRPPKMSNEYLQDKPKDKWHKRVKRTWKILRAHKLPRNIYEAHCPYLISKLLYPKIMFRFDYGDNIGYVSNTLYFNGVGTELGHNNPTVAQVPLGISDAECDRLVRGKLFMSLNRGASESQQKWMESLYPTPSRFEKH